MRLPCDLSQLPKLPRPSAQIGVYFLFKDDELIYVGKTVNLAARLSSSDHQLKDWNTYAFVPVKRARIHITELAYIKALLPKLNNCSFAKRIRASAIDDPQRVQLLAEVDRWRESKRKPKCRLSAVARFS